MKFNFLIYSASHLELAKSCGASEVTIPIEGLCKEGGVSIEKAEEFIEQAKKYQLDIILNCDQLVEERDFQNITQKLQRILNHKLCISDIGLAKWLNEKSVEFHLNLEIGSANEVSINQWISTFPKSLKRVLLNYQIEAKELHPIISNVQCESEILGLGSILMYYSPRKLLSFQNIDQKELFIQADDAGPSDFKFLEHQSGSVMYYSKDLCLLSYLKEFEESGLSIMRINPRFFNDEMHQILNDCFSNRSFDEIKKQWPIPLLHGYYGGNKSDSVFKHLPKRTKDANYEIAAEVIDFDEKSLLIKAINPIPKGAKLRAIDTKKREFIWNAENLSDLRKNELTILEKNTIGLTPRIRTLPTGSFIYFCQNFST